MKSFLPLFLCFILIWSCKQEKSTSEPEKQSTEQKDARTETALENSQQATTLKTATGKSIAVFTHKKSNSLTDFQIVASEFPNTRDTLRIEDADPLQHLWIKDLDNNGFDELYLITSSTGSGSYATIYGYGSNQDLSMTPIYVPEISENDLLPEGIFSGYMGHDSIYSDENRIYRKYPVYKDGDPNCCPSGGEKTVSYQLKAGEAGWILEIDN